MVRDAFPKLPTAQGSRRVCVKVHFPWPSLPPDLPGMLHVSCIVYHFFHRTYQVGLSDRFWLFNQTLNWAQKCVPPALPGQQTGPGGLTPTHTSSSRLGSAQVGSFLRSHSHCFRIHFLRELLRANVSLVMFDTTHIREDEKRLSWLENQVGHQP